MPHCQATELNVTSPWLVSVGCKLRGTGTGGSLEGAGCYGRRLRDLLDGCRPGADDAAAGTHDGTPQQVGVAYCVIITRMKTNYNILHE